MSEDVGKKDAVIIHPTGSIAIIRKRDYDLLLSDQRRLYALRQQLRGEAAAMSKSELNKDEQNALFQLLNTPVEHIAAQYLSEVGHRNNVVIEGEAYTELVAILQRERDATYYYIAQMGRWGKRLDEQGLEITVRKKYTRKDGDNG